jgi:hypothetical protein
MVGFNGHDESVVFNQSEGTSRATIRDNGVRPFSLWGFRPRQMSKAFALVPSLLQQTCRSNRIADGLTSVAPVVMIAWRKRLGIQQDRIHIRNAAVEKPQEARAE